MIVDLETLEKIFEDEKTEGERPLWHARCCKEALPKGLCKTGKPATKIRSGSKADPDGCVVCEHLWEGGHFLTCPRDSGCW